MHNSQWITQSCLVFYSFNANLLHSVIIWLMVSSLSPHNLYLLFCCVLSILALIWLVLIALFYAAMRRDPVSLSKFPFLSHICVFSREMLLISRLKCPLSCFYSKFCFLVIVILLVFVLSILFLVSVFSLFPRFSLSSSSRCIDALTLSLTMVSPLPSSFLDAYSPSTSCLGCNTLFSVISFLGPFAKVLLWSTSRIVRIFWLYYHYVY